MHHTPVFFVALADKKSSQLEKLAEESRDIMYTIAGMAKNKQFRFIRSERTNVEELGVQINLFKDEISVFHFAGHSFIEGINMEDGRFYKEGLVGLLRSMKKLQLVFLNSCSSIKQAEFYINSGVPAVIATSFEIEDGKAARFAKSFYQGMATGSTIAEAYKFACTISKGVFEEFRDVKDTPILSMRGSGKLIILKNRLPWVLMHNESCGDVLDLKLDELLEYSSPFSQLLTPIPRLDVKEDIVGREELLFALRKQLNNTSKPILISGIGGIGKTIFAQAFVNQYLHRYDHILWLEQTEDIKQTFLSNFDLLKNLGLKSTNFRTEDLFPEILRLLRNLKGKNLLVIDNYQEEEAWFKRFPGKPNWDVIVSSRHYYDGFKQFKIDGLDSLSSKKLFYKFYHFETSDTVTDAVLEILGYHPLAIEVVAKTAQRARIPLRNLLERLSSLTHKGGDLLNSVFNKLQLPSLSLTEKWILHQFGALPPIAIPYKMLFDLLGISKQPDWIKDHFSLSLEDLKEKGWLSYEKQEDSFSIHRIIQSAINNQLPLHQEELKPIFHYLKKAYFQLLSAKEKPIAFYWLSLYLESYLIRSKGSFQQSETEAKLILTDLLIKKGEYRKAMFYLKELVKDPLVSNVDFASELSVKSRLGRVYLRLAKFDQAIEQFKAVESELNELETSNLTDLLAAKLNLASACQASLLTISSTSKFKEAIHYATKLFEEILQISKEKQGLFPNFKAVIFENYGLLNNFLGKDDKSLELLNKALSIKKLQLSETHPTTLNTKNNIGKVYIDQKKYEHAKLLFEETLYHQLKNYGSHNLEVANLNHNLGATLLKKGQPEEAFPLLQKALEIRKQILGDNHIYTIYTMMNFSQYYVEKMLQDKAIELLNEALKNIRKIAGQDSILMAHLYKRLGISYFQFDRYKESKILINQARTIYQDKLSDNHRLVKECNDYLNKI